MRWALLCPLLLLIALPISMLLLSWWQVDGAVWDHLAEHLLPRLVGNSFLLLFVVGLGVTLLGVSLAWLSACCEFPGRRWLDPLLILPLAFPTYVLAFIYLAMLDYAGPVQTLLREHWGLSPAWLDAISGPVGVIPIMIIAFFPYVYLLTRTSFANAGVHTFEAARSLGHAPWRVFLSVSLPAARPAIVAGLSLALMETLADFGAVSIYGFDTFTTAIYRTWLGLFNLQAATQLASLLMLFMLVLVLTERATRDVRAAQPERSQSGRRIQLGPCLRWLATGFQVAVILVGVVIPAVQLLIWAGPDLASLFQSDYLELIVNTLKLAAWGSALVVIGGLLLLAASFRAKRSISMIAELPAFGYAIPGSVLAVAIMLALTGLDRWLGTALAGGLGALLLAYLIRFLRIGAGSLEGVAAKIRPQQLEAARSLGAGPIERFRRILLPLLRPGLIMAFLLGLVEIAKEMPATLMLRPFGWDTLAVRIFELTAEGQWERAALPALVLVVLGSIPSILLMRDRWVGQTRSSQ